MLDLKDKKIIYELDVDGFQSNAAIGKKVGVSKQVVGYRIKQLKTKEIIRKIYPIYNLERLGFSGQKIYFTMQDLSKEKEEKIISYFMHHPNVVWFGIYEGRYDYVVSIFEKNKNDLDETLSKILDDLRENIVDFEIATYTGVLALKKKYLLNKQHREEFSYIGGEEEIIMLDETDITILSMLSEDAQLNSVQIASKTNLSADAIILRIKKLKQEGIIQGSRVMLNKKALGINEFKILLKLKRYDRAIHKKFITFCKMNKYIVAYIKCIGPWNLELDIEIPDLNELHGLLLELKTQFADSIKSIETLLLYDEFKYNFYPFIENKKK